MRAHPRDLVLADRAHRPGHDGEVVGRDRDGPAVDLADPGHRAVGREIAIAETLVHVIGQQPVFDPRARIEQQFEPFAHRQLAERVLARDEVVTAHTQRARFALRQVVDERSQLVPSSAGYAVSLAYRVRYVMQFNAREAMHLLELRTGPQGHPAYRRVCQEMHRQIAERAGHRALAELMSHVDHSGVGLERLESERRAESRRVSR